MNNYLGDEPFILCVAAPEDEEAVRKLTDRLSAEGYRLYIRQGEEDPEQEAERLSACMGLLPVISEASEKNARCKNALTMAVGLNKKLMPVLLGKVKLSLFTQLHIAASNYLRLDADKWEEGVKAVLACPWFPPCRLTMEQELKAIRSRREAEKEAWLRQWERETETLLEECRKKWQGEEEGELLLLPLRGGRAVRLRGRDSVLEMGGRAVASVSLREQSCILRARRPMVLYGEPLEPEGEKSLDEPCPAMLEGKPYLLLTGEKAAEVRRRGRVLLLEAPSKQELVLLEKEELTLGREHPWKGGTLADIHVSRIHARLRLGEKGCYLTDVGTNGKGSRNGTWVGTKEDMLRPGQPRQLRDGESIYLGSEENCLIFHEIGITEERQ